MASPEISPEINFEKALSTLTYGLAEQDVPPKDQVLNARRAAKAANIPPVEIDILIFRALAKQLKAVLEDNGYNNRTNIELNIAAGTNNIAADHNICESNEGTITDEELIDHALLTVINPESHDELAEIAENSNNPESNILDFIKPHYIKNLKREYIFAFENLVRTLYDKVPDPTKLDEGIT